MGPSLSSLRILYILIYPSQKKVKSYIVQNHFDCPETGLENRQHCLKNDLNLLYKKTYLSCLYLNLLILKKLHLVIQRLYANNGFNLRAHSYKRAFNNLWSLEDARVEKSRKELQEVLCKNGQQYLRQDWRLGKSFLFRNITLLAISKEMQICRSIFGKYGRGWTSSKILPRTRKMGT